MPKCKICGSTKFDKKKYPKGEFMECENGHIFGKVLAYTDGKGNVIWSDEQ